MLQCFLNIIMMLIMKTISEHFPCDHLIVVRLSLHPIIMLPVLHSYAHSYTHGYTHGSACSGWRQTSLVNRNCKNSPRLIRGRARCCRAHWFLGALLVRNHVLSSQSNLRTVRRSSTDKTSSKLLGSHSPSMLTVRSVNMLVRSRSLGRC